MAMITPRKSILKKPPSFVETDTSGSSSSEEPSPNNRREQIHVKFESIQVRNYNITLGDNPSCAFGPPISLDWDYDEKDPIPLDLYEGLKTQPPRKTHQMIMLSLIRSNLLREQAGVTDDEIEIVVKQMHHIQKERNRTKMGLPFSKLQEIAESAGRKWNRKRENRNSTLDLPI